MLFCIIVSLIKVILTDYEFTDADQAGWKECKSAEDWGCCNGYFVNQTFHNSNGDYATTWCTSCVSTTNKDKCLSLIGGAIFKCEWKNDKCKKASCSHVADEIDKMRKDNPEYFDSYYEINTGYCSKAHSCLYSKEKSRCAKMPVGGLVGIIIGSIVFIGIAAAVVYAMFVLCTCNCCERKAVVNTTPKTNRQSKTKPIEPVNAVDFNESSHTSTLPSTVNPLSTIHSDFLSIPRNGDAAFSSCSSSSADSGSANRNGRLGEIHLPQVVGNYTLTQKLGAGSFGQVFVGIKNNGERYAIKILNKGKSLMDECFASGYSASLNSRFLVRYLEKLEFEDSTCVVMELCEKGDLDMLIKRLKKLEKDDSILKPSRVSKIFIQLTIGLYVLHGNKIIHRDLKPANIFVDKEDNVKIGDFGCSTDLESTDGYAATQVGTLLYESPEVLEGRPYNCSSDMWALGVVMYELCTLERPFAHPNQYVLQNLIKAGKYEKISNSEYSDELCSIIHSLLNTSPRERPTALALLRQPYIQREGKKLDIFKYFPTEV